ncbi:MAG TPA: potassium transporter Kup [Gaiellales bacterium]|nr:potassium transporter Kup [Gaiellales bacterium]
MKTVTAGAAPARPIARRSDESHGHAKTGRWGAFALSIGALGVVYGDIGTSPLYTMQLIFTVHPLAPTPAHVYGALSLIFWSLVLVVTLKYVLLILRADNHGEGGIMALVALIQRSMTGRRREVLILVGILGASLFYGDGMLTPAISVVSAVSGLQVASPTLASQVVPFSLAILIALFMIQRFGTGTIGFLFGPIMLVWFAVLGAIGLHEVAKDPAVIRSLSPTYGAQFLWNEPTAGFLSLASVFLAVTGAEAIYADMGHFGRKPITHAWLIVCLPTLMLNYLGQGALVLHHPAAISNPFFIAVPGGQTAQKAMVILATMATVIASQAVISGAYSVTQQLVQLGFLPRMSIRHTSAKIRGQIYIPLVNWSLMAAVVGLVIGFRDPEGLASAYGVALSAIFATNTLLAFSVFRVLWRKPLKVVIPGAAFFLTIELTFFAANLGKLFSGGWIPLAVGAVFFTVITTWRRGRAILNRRISKGRVPLRRYLNRMVDDPPLRVPGTAVFLTSSQDTVPPALLTNAEHNHVVHEQVILLTVETAGIPKVPESGRLKISRYRLGFVGIVARYGYQEEPDVPAALRLAAEQGLDIDFDDTSYYVNHVSLIPTGERTLSRWRAKLFAVLHQNSTPAARYFRIPPDRVLEVGVYVAM